VPILVVAFLLSLVLTEVPLSVVAGMVARGEAVESEEELLALQGVPADTSIDGGRHDAPAPLPAR
jgi:hypothetical protein